MDELRRAAREALERHFVASRSGGAHVGRISVDVDLDDQRDLVSLRLAPGGGLSWSCTCAETNCRHAAVALELLAGGTVDGLGHLAEPPRAESIMPDLTRSSVPPDVRTVEASDQAERADKAALSAAIDEVITAVMRSGVADGVSATVSEALRGLIEAAPEPLPLGISRWLGRLEQAVVEGQVEAVARVLHGAAQVADDLRAENPDADAERRIVSWLGALTHEGTGVDSMSDRTMVEVAREWLPGVAHAGIERRYLVDMADGHTYREERSPSARTTSLGPCPRVISVGLASVETGASPRRLRLLQYVASPRLDDDTAGQLGHWGVRAFASLVDRYRDAVTAFPGLAEPFALVSPDSVVHDERPHLLDDAGAPLPLTGDDDPSILTSFAELTRVSEPAWVAGRLLDREGTLMMRPLSLAVMREGRLCFNRL